jgi:MFS family permease
LSIEKSMAGIVPLQLGAFAGYLSFGFLAERWGRRATFIGFLLVAAALVPIYGRLNSPTLLLAMGPLLGYFGHGYFSLFGSMLAELYPTSIRATGQGVTYGVGRGLSALAPYTIGALAERYKIGPALALTSAFFVTGAILSLFLPPSHACLDDAE